MSEPHYQDDWLTIYAGDARDVMAEMPEASVDCVVTSPPYWGLRDYGTASWEGGDPDCDHLPPDEAGDTAKPTAGQRAHAGRFSGPNCWKCGADRIDDQIGLEPTPEEYVANMVAVFAEVRRVLKPTGTVWLNLGDSYNNRTKVRTSSHQPALNNFEDDNWADRAARGGVRMSLGDGIKEKDLVGIPWRVAFALQADGWYLRSDIIWAKKNGMPESVTDRPTRAHEYIFLLTKSPRYYYDIDAVRQEPAPSTVQRLGQNDGHPVWNGNRERGFPGSDQTIDINKMLSPGGANLRDVWWMATMPYPDAHFAVFPPELPEKCILAGSSEKGVCPECGAPWERVTERRPNPAGITGGKHREVARPEGISDRSGRDYEADKSAGLSLTVGWSPSCGCRRDSVTSAQSGHSPSYPSPNSEYDFPQVRQVGGEYVASISEAYQPVPSVILDPFGGSGTTGMVANRLSRKAILIDLNPDYITQQMKRNANLPLGLSA